MTNLVVLNHPALKHKLGLLRSEDTNPVQFRLIVEELSVQLAYEASRELEVQEHTIKTPVEDAQVQMISTWPSLMAIMRSGIAMVRPIQGLLPMSKVGHIGIYQEKKLNTTVEYFLKAPKNLNRSPVYLLDILIGTGSTANAAITRLKECGATDIKFLCLLASKDGAKSVTAFHPDVTIYTIEHGDALTADGFLSPGIGDAGQRYFNFN